MRVENQTAATGRHAGALLLVAVVSLAAAGCKDREQADVTSFTVPKERATGPLPGGHPPTGGGTFDHPASPMAGPTRMLAAIVSRGEQAWFFKLVGPTAQVDPRAEAFREMIGSVKFTGADGAPEWKLPEGWKQRPASGMRFATIDVTTPEGTLDLSVSALKVAGEFQPYVLANVNRWRQQLGLEPTTQARLFGPGERSGELTEVSLTDGQKALLVDLAATVAAAPAPTPAPSVLGGPAAGPRPVYQTPEGWTDGKAEGMRLASLRVQDGDHSAEVTVIALPTGSGDLLSNVNRWREQVGLAPFDQARLDAEAKDVAIDDAKGRLVALIGPEEAKPRLAILGVVCPRGDQVWFLKMIGDAALVQRERERFEKFVGSLKFGDRAAAGQDQAK